MIRLCWELTGTLLLGAVEEDTELLRYPEICLGLAGDNKGRFWPAVIADARKLLALRGWKLSQHLVTMGATGGQLPGMDRTYYPEGSQVIMARLIRAGRDVDQNHQRLAMKAFRREITEDNNFGLLLARAKMSADRLPPGVVPSASALSTLTEVYGTSNLHTTPAGLLWLSMLQIYCQPRPQEIIFGADTLTYSQSDWDVAQAILATRGWRLTRQSRSGGYRADVEDMAREPAYAA